MEFNLQKLIHRPVFISIDGMDGLGKSTQINLLKQLFENEGIEVITTAEAKGTPIAEVIRSEYLSGKRKTSNYVNAYAFTADRFDRFFNEEYGVITRAQDKPCVILADRFIASSLVYSSLHIDDEGKIRENMKQMREINMPIIQALTRYHNMNFLLLPKKPESIEFIADRLAKRRNEEGTEEEIYESKLMLINQCQYFVLAESCLSKLYPTTILINPEDTISLIHDRIVSCVLRELWR